jgi:hypothetical protein
VRSWGTILAGAIGLAVLDAVVSTTGGAQRVGGFLAGAGGFVQKIISAQVPAFATTGATTAASVTPATTSFASVVSGTTTQEGVTTTPQASSPISVLV